jgi:lipocalin
LGYVIYEDDSHRSFVVGLGDGAKSFLASRIPHLKFDSLVEHVNSFDFEVDACNLINIV